MTPWAQHRPTRTAHALRDPPGPAPGVRTWCDRVLPLAELVRISPDTVRAPLCPGCLARAPLPYGVADLPRDRPGELSPSGWEVTRTAGEDDEEVGA
ncbi:MAG TPA: hypothetical protein VIL00_02445 [Pseudonocardiaceae bacterium]